MTELLDDEQQVLDAYRRVRSRNFGDLEVSVSHGHLVKIFEEQTGWFLTMHGGTKIFGDPSEKGPSPKDVWTEQNEEIEHNGLQ